MQRWLDKRQAMGFNARQPVFCTLKGGPISAPYVRMALVRLAKRAGITKRVHPHGLRHTLAFELANEGVATQVIQAQLGHASLTTTDRYIRHLAPQQVIEAMKNRQWSL